MAKKYVEFKDVYGNAVFVNQDLVTCVRQYDEEQTNIYFGNEHMVTLEGSAHDVALQLADL